MNALDNGLSTNIDNDVTGTKEDNLETHLKTELQRLQTEGKVSALELTNLYKTNFKKLLSGKVDTNPQLERKKTQVTQLTNKLIAVELSKNPGQTETRIGRVLKGAMYGALSINKDIEKNGPKTNFAKGIVDEFISLPELLEQALRHPIDTAKSIGSALRNFSELIQSLATQYTDLFRGMQTPQKQYNSGRSLALIVMTLIPGAIGKVATKLAKPVMSGAKKVVQQGGKAIERVKGKIKPKSKTTRSQAPKKLETPHAKAELTKLQQEAGEAVKKTQDKLTFVNNKLKKKQTDINKNKLSAQKKSLEKELTQNKRNLNDTNKQLGLDNRKMSQKSKREQELQQIDADLAKKGKHAVNQKQLPKTIKRKDYLTEKLKNYSTLSTKLKQIPGVTFSRLEQLGLAPQKWTILKSLRHRKRLRSERKLMNQQSVHLKKSLDITKKGSNPPITVLEFAQKYPQASGSQNILKQHRERLGVQSRIQTLQPSIDGLKQTIKDNLIGYGIIAGAQVVVNDNLLIDIEKYLHESNDQQEVVSQENTGLEANAVNREIPQDIINQLNALTEKELAKATIQITGKASKTGTATQNQRLAEQRAEHIKTKVMQLYPKVGNITTIIELQPSDSTDELTARQGTSIQIVKKNDAYLAAYESVKTNNGYSTKSNENYAATSNADTEDNTSADDASTVYRKALD